MMRRALAALLSVTLVASGAHAAVNNPPTAGFMMLTSIADPTPANTKVCLVGDSITFAQVQMDTTAITASGGTAPYTFSVPALPTGVTNVTSSPNLYFDSSTSPGTPGTYPITVTATDSAAAQASRTYNVTISNNYVVSVVATGASSGAFTLSDMSILNVNDSNRGPGWWTQFLSRGRVTVPQTGVFGRSGATTASTLTAMTPPISADCGSYVVLIGTNDLNNGGSPSLATLQANLSSIWLQLRATGRPVSAIPIMPRTLTVPTNQNSMDMLFAAEAYIRRQNAAGGLRVVDGLVEFIDTSSSTASPKSGATGDYDYTYDGLHPKGIGAYYAFKKVSDLVALMYPDPGPTVISVADLYSANNTTGSLIANGMMSGTAGTAAGRVTGTVASSWTATSSDNGCSPCTFTGTASMSTLSDGTPAQQIVVAGTAGGGFQTEVRLTQSLTGFTNFSTGDKLQASCRVEMDAGSAHVTAPFIKLTYTAGGVAYSLQSGATGKRTPTVSDASPTTAYSGQLFTPLPAPAAVGGFSGTLTVSAGVWLTNAGSVTVGATFRIGACALRKV